MRNCSCCKRASTLPTGCPHQTCLLDLACGPFRKEPGELCEYARHSLHLDSLICQGPLTRSERLHIRCALRAGDRIATRYSGWHIRKVPLHEQPRRIAHQAQTRTLAVLTEIPGYTIGALTSPDKCSLRLLDDQASPHGPDCASTKHSALRLRLNISWPTVALHVLLSIACKHGPS